MALLLNGGESRLTGAPAAFFKLLDKHVADARIRFELGGRSYVAGGGPPNCSEFAVRVHRERLFRRVIAQGNLGFGESYMDRDFEMAEGSLPDLLTALLRARLGEKLKSDPRLALRLLGIRLAGALRSKASNVHRHYDVGDDLFESFLDSNLIYSCGYAESADDDLEQLQTNKCDRICRKLRLSEGLHLLDIGCGFGGLLLYAARHYGVTAVGVTNSRAHCEKASARIQAAGLSGRIRVELRDFREIQGKFDRIVSVGMLEHVPAAEYGPYFARIAACLAEDGLGLVHAIGRPVAKAEHDPFIQKYIFPGSSQVALSEVAACLERERLPIWDVENIKNHYGYTVRHWLERFQQARPSLDPLRYDARFQRMFEYYLACGIAAAFVGEASVFQILFARDYTAAVPLHRV